MPEAVVALLAHQLEAALLVDVDGSDQAWSGTVRMIRLPRLAQAETISSVWVHCGTVGVILTAGQCFLGLYNLAGTRLAVSASIEASFLTTGIKQISLTVPYAASAGDDLLVAALFNGTTPPGLSAATSLAGAVRHNRTM